MTGVGNFAYCHVYWVNIFSHFCYFSGPLFRSIDIEIEDNLPIYSHVAIGKMLTHEYMLFRGQ